MTYTIHFTDNTKPPFSIDPFRYDGPGAINGQHTSLTLLGKGYSDYGQEMWTNLVHMLENHSDSMPPAVSIEGQLWYDNSSVSNLKICKKAQGGGYKWIDVVDTETLQKLLYSSDFFSESILQSNVRVPSGLATIDGDIHIKGKLVVDRGIVSNTAPSTGNEVVTLSYLSSRLTSITSKYVPLKLPAGTTTIDGKLGSLSVGGDLTVTGTLTVPKDPTQQTDATNKKYVDTAIQNGGVSWPNKTPKTVLVTPNGTDVAFIDITPEYICKTDLTIPPDKTGFNVIASDPSADRAYWLNLDDSYLFLHPSTVVQEVKSDKKFNKLTLAGEVKDSTGSPGTAGDVLKSQGPNLPPVWGTGSGGGGGGGNTSGLPTLAPGVLTSDGTAMGWVNGMVGQFLTITNLNTYGWVDIFGSMKQNDLAGSPTTGYYSRGYLQLPNDVLLQWIVGKPIYATTDIAPAKVLSDWGSFYKSTDEFAFLTMAGTDITCKYKFELPFETVFFNSVSTNVTPLVTSTATATTTDVNANGEYKTLKVPPLTSIFSDSTIVTHAHVTLSVPVTKDKVNPLLAPVIFALGKAPNGNKVEPNTQIFTANGTWTVPDGVKTLTFHIVGGGAGGGEGYVNDNWNGGGAGGGSGAYKIITLAAADYKKDDVFSIKVGLGGPGGEPPKSTIYAVASSGGTSRVYKNGSQIPFKTSSGDQLSVAGGAAQTTRTDKDGTTGGIGGAPGGRNGGNGGSSIDNGGATATGGKGGDSPIPYTAGMYDGGGIPGKLSGTSLTVNGGPGQGYGAGGGGASIRGKGTGAGTGGAGAGGVVIVKWTT